MSGVWTENRDGFSTQYRPDLLETATETGNGEYSDKKARRLPKKKRNGYGNSIAALVIFIGCAIAVTLNNRQNSNKVSTSEPVSMAEKNISYIQG